MKSKYVRVGHMTHLSLIMSSVRIGLAYFLLFYHRRDICNIALCSTLLYQDSTVKLSKTDIPVKQNMPRDIPSWKHISMHDFIVIERNNGL